MSEAAQAGAEQEDHGQQHPISIYLYVWILLFVLSAFSYATDFMSAGVLRWTLILLLMMLKAGFIVAIFMHVKWERMALVTAILGPPLVLLVLIGLMLNEGQYVFDTRVDYLGQPEAAERIHVTHGAGHGTEASDDH